MSKNCFHNSTRFIAAWRWNPLFGWDSNVRHGIDLKLSEKSLKHFWEGFSDILGVRWSRDGLICRKIGPITVPEYSLLRKSEIHFFARNSIVCQGIELKLSQNPRNTFWKVWEALWVFQDPTVLKNLSHLTCYLWSRHQAFTKISEHFLKG